MKASSRAFCVRCSRSMFCVRCCRSACSCSMPDGPGRSGLGAAAGEGFVPCGGSACDAVRAKEGNGHGMRQRNAPRATIAQRESACCFHASACACASLSTASASSNGASPGVCRCKVRANAPCRPFLFAVHKSDCEQLIILIFLSHVSMAVVRAPACCSRGSSAILLCSLLMLMNFCAPELPFHWGHGTWDDGTKETTTKL